MRLRPCAEISRAISAAAWLSRWPSSAQATTLYRQRCGAALSDGRVTGTPHAGMALTESGRDWRLGWRLTSAGPGDPGFEVALEATRSESDNNNAEHGVMLRGAVRW